MSEGKLASGMVNGINGKNSIESHVQAGILLLSQSSILVRHLKGDLPGVQVIGSPQLSQDRPSLSPSPLFPYDCCLEYLAHVSQAAVGPVVISSLCARLVWKR